MCSISLCFQMDKLDPITQDLETGVIMGGRRGRYILGVISKIFIQALTLTFLAEWGDRSQIATIILGAREVSTRTQVHKTLY